MDKNLQNKDEIIQIHDTDSEGSPSKDSKCKNGNVLEILSSDEDDDDDIEFLESEEDSEPDIECDLWDGDCKILPHISENMLIGYHSKDVMFPTVTAPALKKARFSLEINDSLTTDNFVKEFQEKWNTNQTLNMQNAELITDPFKFCIFQNYVSDKVFLDNIRLFFNEIDWNKRNLDLYEFFQSKTLKNSDKECLTEIYNFLNENVREWVSKLTGTELIKTSATCSFYSNTDFLLVHDDLQEDRMFAFVLYLTGPENWDASWGGSLQLLDCNERGHPGDIKKSINPANNQLILFPVTNRSYHQVEEVLTMNYCRLSINGWFHVSEVPKFDVPKKENPQVGLFSENLIKALEIDAEIQTWIKEKFLQNHVMDQIQKHIEEYSEISLEGFFIDKKFTDVVNALNNSELKWSKAGPPNRKNYLVLEEANLPEILEQFINVFKSVEMFSLLHRYTDLELKTEKARMRYELQKWESGSYSLLTDYNWADKEELDVILYIGCTDGSIVGGKTVFVSLDEQIQDALITIEPVQNNFNLIYRDSARYTQYVSKLSTVAQFYILICSYSES